MLKTTYRVLPRRSQGETFPLVSPLVQLIASSVIAVPPETVHASHDILESSGDLT